MNWLEKEIQKNQRRIDRIASQPSSTKLRANKLFYELERDLRISQLDAWHTGKPPLINNDHLFPLVYALGGIGIDSVGVADRTTLATEYFDFLRANNFPDDACDRTVVIIALCASGQFPPPNLIISTDMACPLECISPKAIGEFFNRPVFHISTSIKSTEEGLACVTDQIGELIEFAEAKVPGVKYSEEKLIYGLEMDRLAHECLRKIHEIRKRVPCPLDGQDVFRLPKMPTHYPQHARP